MVRPTWTYSRPGRIRSSTASSSSQFPFGLGLKRCEEKCFRKGDQIFDPSVDEGKRRKDCANAQSNEWTLSRGKSENNNFFHCQNSLRIAAKNFLFMTMTLTFLKVTQALEETTSFSGALEIETVIVPDFETELLSNSESSFSNAGARFTKIKTLNPGSQTVAQEDALFLSKSQLRFPFQNKHEISEPQISLLHEMLIQNEQQYSTVRLTHAKNEIREPTDSYLNEIEGELSEPQDSTVLFNQLRRAMIEPGNSISQEMIETHDSTVWVNEISNKPQNSTALLNPFGSETQAFMSGEDDNEIIEPEESTLRMRPSQKPILLDDDSNELDGDPQTPVQFENGRGYSKPNKFRRKQSRMNRNRNKDEEKESEQVSDGFAEKMSTVHSTVSTSTKQKSKNSPFDRTFNELLPGDGEEKPKTNSNKTSTNRERSRNSFIDLHPPVMSKKTYAIGFILIFCCAVAIIINFINLHSDFQDLKDFHRGFMGRKLLILEGRLTSRTYINQLRECKAYYDGKAGTDTSQIPKPEPNNGHQLENGHAFKFQGNNGEAEPVVEEHANVVYTKSARPFPGISIIGNSNEHYRDTTSSCSSLQAHSFGNSPHHQHQNQNCTIMSPKYGKGKNTPTATTALVAKDDNGTYLNGNHVNSSNEKDGHDPHKKAVKFHSDKVKIFVGPVPNVSIIALQQKVHDPFASMDQFSSIDQTFSLDSESILQLQQPSSTHTALLAADKILQNRTIFLQQHLPLRANEFIEDHDPEWRDLDYSCNVGSPPDNFCQFIIQYDWNVFTTDGLSNSNIVRRRNLLRQFRIWKIRKRKLWAIVVTERAKKEMADQEKSNSRK